VPVVSGAPLNASCLLPLGGAAFRLQVGLQVYQCGCASIKRRLVSRHIARHHAQGRAADRQEDVSVFEQGIPGVLQNARGPWRGSEFIQEKRAAGGHRRNPLQAGRLLGLRGPGAVPKNRVLLCCGRKLESSMKPYPRWVTTTPARENWAVDHSVCRRPLIWIRRFSET
jgi:hypothetical protein